VKCRSAAIVHGMKREQKCRPAKAEHQEILPEALFPGKEQRSLKELLLAMPEGGEDADFERSPDLRRAVEL
jgi:hypothetical protein